MQQKGSITVMDQSISLFLSTIMPPKTHEKRRVGVSSISVIGIRRDVHSTESLRVTSGVELQRIEIESVGG